GRVADRAASGDLLFGAGLDQVAAAVAAYPDPDGVRAGRAVDVGLGDGPGPVHRGEAAAGGCVARPVAGGAGPDGARRRRRARLVGGRVGGPAGMVVLLDLPGALVLDQRVVVLV